MKINQFINFFQDEKHFDHLKMLKILLNKIEIDKIYYIEDIFELVEIPFDVNQITNRALKLLTVLTMLATYNFCEPIIELYYENIFINRYFSNENIPKYVYIEKYNTYINVTAKMLNCYFIFNNVK